MITKQKDLVVALERLIDIIKNADKIDMFKFNVTNEIQEVPTRFWMERELTGWVNFNLVIRLQRHP